VESICLRKVSANLTGLSEQYFYPKKTIEEKNLAAFSHAIRLLLAADGKATRALGHSI